MKLIPIFKYHNFSIIRLSILFIVLFSSMITDVYAQKQDSFVVVLDAGHGGKDVGCGGKHGFLHEKDVALSIVLKAGKILSSIPGVKVIYTRDKDVFVDLWKRGDIANEADADLFVSVHCNSSSSTQPLGSETFVLSLKGNDRNFNVAKAENEVILQEENHKERYQGFDPSNPTSVIGLSVAQEEYLEQSLLLASLIQTDFEKSLNRFNRGVKQAAFIVLYQSYMPSVLIETGFLSNLVEGKYLSDVSGQHKMANSIAKSITKYYNQQKLNVAVNNYYDGDVITSPSTNNTVVNSSENTGAYYKVQLASSKNKISTSSNNFKGLKEVERVEVNGFYKYYLGRYSSRVQANSGLDLAKSKGYKTAFIVGFNDEENLGDSLKKQITAPVAVNPVVSDIYYKVQIASSTSEISTNSSNFKGLEEVESVKVGSYYKYYLGKTSNYNEAKKYLEAAKSKKYNSAFVVAFLNNETISVKEALKRQTN